MKTAVLVIVTIALLLTLVQVASAEKIAGQDTRDLSQVVAAKLHVSTSLAMAMFADPQARSAVNLLVKTNLNTKARGNTADYAYGKDPVRSAVVEGFIDWYPHLVGFLPKAG